MDSTQQTLIQAYREILSDLPTHWLDRSRAHEAEFAGLSGLFLPGTSSAYLNAPRRIMVVGRETRRWNVVTDASPFTTLDNYISRAMGTQQRQLSTFLNRSTDRGESFFNLLRALASRHGPDGIAWANLFSFAVNGKSPMRWENFGQLRRLSERLLKAQIHILQPDIIIFANGASSARWRQRYFPHKGESSVCSEMGSYREQGIPTSQLWRFRMNDSIQCYRIQHPSSISVASRAARRFLLDEVLGERPQLENTSAHSAETSSVATLDAV